jgi:hypothetical protein
MLNDIVKEVCVQMPFDVIGGNTLLSGVPHETEQLLLTFMILTSDDVIFSAALSEPLQHEQKLPLENMYQDALQKLPGKPVMALAEGPMLINVGCDELLDYLDEACGGIPIFGTFAIDYVTTFRDTRIIFNGETYSDRMAIILLYGDVQPKFRMISVAEGNLLKQKAVITKSKGNLLMEVNDMPILNYFEKFGFVKNSKLMGMVMLPLVVDFNDNAQTVTRSIIAQTPEGYLLCGASMPTGCSFSIATMNIEDVINTSTDFAKNLAESDDDNFLMYSCAVRSFALGIDNIKELKTVDSILSSKKKYMISYSGGEICPVHAADGTLKNRFHNVTLVCCSFQ